MSVTLDQDTGDIVINGWEKGIATSPHQGIGNLQCANIATEQGEVMANYGRNQVNISQTGTLSFSDSSHLNIVSISPNIPPAVGTWIQVNGSSNTGQLANGYYQVTSYSSGFIQLAVNYRGVALTTYGSGLTASFSTVIMGAQIVNQGFTEQYADSSGNTQYRYYIPEVSGRIWVLDTGYANSGWSIATNGTDITTSYGTCTGFVVLNGNALLFTANTIYYKLTVRLDVTWAIMTSTLNSLPSSKANHYATINHNSFCYYCDQNFVGSIIPSSVSSGGNVNIWAYGTFTSDNGSPSNLTVTSLIGGNIPVVNQYITFSTSIGGSLTAISANTIYFVKTVTKSSTSVSFTISSTVGGTAINTVSGSGTLYFNSFNPNSSTSNTYSLNTQALALNVTDISQCICELSSNLFIGCQSNVIYNWNEISISANGVLTVLQLPESNTSNIVQANNTAYCFSGNKGNVYVTSGSAVSLAMTVPDYCAGIPSANAYPNTPYAPQYVEPYFLWGGTNFMRGRIWLSLQDQTAAKTGNCGGIWSFVPSFFNPTTGNDLGLQIHLENQNSYNTYNGMATIILPLANQMGLGPQYYSAWQSDQNSGSATYGIDNTNTYPQNVSGFTVGGNQVLIESDIVPTGSILGKQKKTFGSVEYKLTAPLSASETITLNYRQNLTDKWQSCGTLNKDTPSGIAAAYNPISFEKGLWIQFQILMNSTSSGFSFCRLYEVRIHPQ